MSNLLILAKYILDSHRAVSYRKKYEARLLTFVLEKTNEFRQKSCRSLRLVDYRIFHRVGRALAEAGLKKGDYLIATACELK